MLWLGPVEALIIGGSAGILCQQACGTVKSALEIDDTPDVLDPGHAHDHAS